MRSFNFRSPASDLLQTQEGFHQELAESDPYAALRTLGVASLVIAATALGVFLGRELRQRYKFNRRTPYDFYSNAGDPVTRAEYGMGI